MFESGIAELNCIRSDIHLFVELHSGLRLLDDNNICWSKLSICEYFFLGLHEGLSNYVQSEASSPLKRISSLPAVLRIRDVYAGIPDLNVSIPDAGSRSKRSRIRHTVAYYVKDFYHLLWVFCLPGLGSTNPTESGSETKVLTSPSLPGNRWGTLVVWSDTSPQPLASRPKLQQKIHQSHRNNSSHQCSEFASNWKVGSGSVSASICRWQAKMYGIWAYLSTFSNFWAFFLEARIRNRIRINGKGRIRIRIRSNVTSRIRIRIRIKVTSRIRIRLIDADPQHCQTQMKCSKWYTESWRQVFEPNWHNSHHLFRVTVYDKTEKNYLSIKTARITT